MYSPYVSTVYKESAFKYPEQLGTILDTQIKTDVATLVDEVSD